MNHGIAVIVVLLTALAAGGGVWLAQRDDETPPTATGVTTAPTPSAGPTTPQAQTMTVRVYFHEQAPGPESDPHKVVAVSRTMPRSPKVATAALNELLRGPTAGERAAGYWSFFSDDTAGMLRSVRVTAGTGFADFRDFRRLLPNATGSYGSTALLAELDATLRQFPTIKRTLYAFNGEVPAFYSMASARTPVDADGHLAHDRAGPHRRPRRRGRRVDRPPAAGLGRPWPPPRCGPPPAA
jgi:hypothetical protein